MKFRSRTPRMQQCIVNRAGGVAYKESPELELTSLVLTSFVKDKFYESSDEQLWRLHDLVRVVKDKKFIGQLAIYARTKFGMRSITHALISELVNVVKGEDWTKDAVSKTIFRPDDMLEMLSYYINTFGKPIPNSLKRGIRLAIPRFNAYQLAKYRGEGSSFKLVDLFNLVHPKPTEKSNNTFEDLMEGKLKSDTTWESMQTRAGQEATTEEEKIEAKAEVWRSLIKEKKIGYFALLRNLRNIVEQAPDVVDDAIKMLTNKDLIRDSLVLPFRFQTAINAIQNTSFDRSRDVIVALDKALELSLDNVPTLSGKTLVAVDDSGSMRGRPSEIASMFGAVLYKKNNADLMAFANNAVYVTANPRDSITTIGEKIRSATDGGTNFNAIFEQANKLYDRIIILSDMQGWMSDSYGSDGGAPKQSFADYKNRSGSNPFIYSFDLQGYGDLQFPENKVFALAGFSEKVFELMPILEQDRRALVNEIERVEI